MAESREQPWVSRMNWIFRSADTITISLLKVGLYSMH